MKINITLNNELLQRIDEFAKANYMTRSGFIQMCCNQYLVQNEAVQCIREITDTMKVIAERGFIDTETREQLDKYESIFKEIEAASKPRAY